MDAIPLGIWVMWIFVFGMAFAATGIAFYLNKKEGGDVEW